MVDLGTGIIRPLSYEKWCDLAKTYQYTTQEIHYGRNSTGKDARLEQSTDHRGAVQGCWNHAANQGYIYPPDDKEV